MKVDEMDAGRELDALVAEKVMGGVPTNAIGDWMVAVGAPPYYRFGGSVRGLPDYSTDIAAAWQIDDAKWFWMFEETDGYLEATLWDHRRRLPDYYAVDVAWSDDGNRSKAYALARCILALAAV